MEELEIQENLIKSASSVARKVKTFVLLGTATLQLPIWGVAQTFGILQEAYSHFDFLDGPRDSTAVVGTTMNGVIYLSIPMLFTILDRGRWSSYRRPVAMAGGVLTSTSFVISSFSARFWHLVLLQGIFGALGSSMMYSSSTLYLDDWFSSGRATAYGAVLSSKSIVGTAFPVLLSLLIQKIGVRWTLRVWAVIVLVTGSAGTFIVPHKATLKRKIRHTPWSFLRHATIYRYMIANMVFSCAYAMPQTYVSQYANDALHLSTISSSLIITAFNAPSIFSTIAFGLMSDKLNLSATAITLISAVGSSMAVFLLWATVSNHVPCRPDTFLSNLRPQEATSANEAINTGMIHGLLNGACEIGYAVSGFLGVELFKSGAVVRSGWGLGTQYGTLILFTGIGSFLGGSSILWSGYQRLKAL
ncbi:MFS-type transporter pynF [Acrodontium crateriforme]|uniref:MFS-type transporter pynF n=1 Tax=Acrodontium crateriforme TaxID=150365 RepID=A0AAQ3RBW6_9PEZI|nr:MFS-type transporter pynF [Acrodontium crateriforme]